MKQELGQISLLVKDYDEAIAYYTQKLNFELLEDTVLSDTKRWVVLSPKGSKACKLLLAKAANPEQAKSIGNQCGGRVFLFLYTDNFERDYATMLSKQVNFVREPVKEKWGTVAVFADLYGNLWDFIEDTIE